MNARSSAIEIETPVGPMAIAGTDDALTIARFGRLGARDPGERHETPLLCAARAELAAYFAGRCARFTIPVAPSGTAFQREVWGALLRIPFGRTLSYAALGAEIGRPGASRAVGSANARNPLAVIVPCHRVIAADGSLAGYAGGTEIKRWLLAHERSASLGGSVTTAVS
jgi:methylated-DNA-[protein]-cysteine S-methyltransferase